MSRVTKVLADKASPLSPWALSRVQRASSHLLILHSGHTEVLRDCGKNLRLFLTVRSLVFSNLSQDKMPISSLHPIANLPICLRRAPAALCLTFLSYVFTQCSIFVTFYFILVFSAAEINKKILLTQHRRDSQYNHTRCKRRRKQNLILFLAVEKHLNKSKLFLEVKLEVRDRGRDSKLLHSL